MESIAGSHPLSRLLVAVVFLALAGVPAPARAASNDKLTEFDFLLLGLTVRPEPEFQVVPRNTATGIRVELSFATAGVAAAGLLSLLPSSLEVAAELVGPGLDQPVDLRAPPGELLPVPPLVTSGLYLVRDIRLIDGDGTTFLRASPDSATVEVIDRILITKITTRPLTLEEIRQKGILFGDDDFTGFNFTLALKLDSRPVNIELPVIFDSNDIPIPIRPSAGIDLEGATVPLINTGIVPVMIHPELTEEDEELLADVLPDIHIPGLLVIPGDVGFLNQFFSALLIVSNGAPVGSGLTVADLQATLQLPPGDDQIAGTSDDPLEVAETGGGQAFVLPIQGVGRDGVGGTGDDTDRFEPGEQGQAEFLLEGRAEGFHAMAFDIEGILEGLPVGPVPITGLARGGVLVRNPFFNMTFSAPATVRAGEEFSLYITVSNISGALANLLTVTLDQAALSGATLLESSTRQIDTLPPGDSEVLRFRFRSDETGQVTASHLKFHQIGGQNTGDLRFTLGVGERGVPLSPDTIVLPSSVEALPAQVVEGGLRVLGQAWSVATAPTGTLPDGVTRVSKNAVIDRALELAEAGFRVQVGEPLHRALESLAFGWVGAPEAGFEEILRETHAGGAFLTSVGQSLSPIGSIADFQREVSASFTSLPAHILIGVGDTGGASPVTWQVTDAAGRTLDTAAGSSTLPNGAFLPLSAPAQPGRGMGLLSRLGSSLYEVRFTGTGTGLLDLGVSLPRPDGSTGLHVFSAVAVDVGLTAKVEVDLLAPSSPLSLAIDRDGDGFFEETITSAPEEILASSGPRLLAASAIGPETLSGADPWGRVVALLFDREVREAEANDATSYQVEANPLLSAIRQLSGRLVLLFLRDPVGSFVPRTVTVSGLFDTTGKPMLPPVATSPMTSRLTDPGAVVSGRVLRADGSPLTGAEVLYINSTPGKRIGISQKTVEPDGRYSFDYVRQSPDGPFAIRAADPETGGVQELTTNVRTNGEHIVVDLVLLGRGGVTGVVRDLADNPVIHAEVLVTSQVDPANFSLAETDGDGHYTATDLLVGPVVVKAVFGTSSGVASGNIQRAGTFATVDVVINLDLGGRVSGGVFELDGADVTTPVPGTQVYYLVPREGGGEVVAASDVTASDGRFLFEGLPTGPFRILAIDRVTGRQAFSAPLTLVAGAELDVPVFFRTEAVGAIQGQVLTASGDPAAGVLVTAAGRQVTTDASGSFGLNDVPVGSHNVSARLPGSPRSAFAQVEVTEGEVAVVTLALPGAGQVAVTVLDTAGLPVPSQQVIQVSPSSPCTGVARFTDAAGVALFDDVLIPGATFKALRGADLAEGRASIQREGDSASLVLPFAGFGTVTGTVLDPDGSLVFGADVVLGARRLDQELCTFVSDPQSRQVQTAPDGTFALGEVPVGAITVSASSFVFTVPTTVKDALLADGDTRDFTLTLVSRLAGGLKGTVFLPDGLTPSGPGVSVTASSALLPDVTVTTGAGGEFRFAKIFPAGGYTLTASDPVTGARARRSIFLQEEQDLTADLRLLGRGAVEVTVVDGAGNPVDRAFVELKGAAFPFDEAAGAITPLGGGTIRFGGISEGDFTVTANDNVGRGGRANGMMPEEGATVEVAVSLTVTGTVRGAFLTSDGGEPMPNAEVRLRQGTTGRLLGSTTTSSAPGALGTFEFSFVPAGSVLATATDPLTGRIGEASGTIETEGEVLELEILQLGLGKVSGTVTRGDSPVAGATVDLTSVTGLSATLANLEATAISGARGEFSFDPVPVGSFTILATVPGLLLTGTASGSIETDGQEIRDIEAALEPSGTITGTVLRADGLTPVPGAGLTLQPSTGLLRAEADSAGSYRFELVPAGRFTLTAQENGGPDAGLTSGTLAGGEDLVLNVSFNGTGTVEGRAFHSDGVTPASSGRVRLTRQAPFGRDQTANVGSDGSFQFLGIPVGTYTLSLTVTGSPLRGTASGEISADGDVVTTNIQLADAGSVLGTVLRADGAFSAPNTLVSVTSGGFTLNGLTDGNGSFRIDGIPLGSFGLRAEDPVSGGLAIASGAVSVKGEEVDVGVLVLDTAPIAVESVAPSDGATFVPPDSLVLLRFTDPVEPASLQGRFSVSSGGSILPGSTQLSAQGLELTFAATPSLPPSREVQVFVSKDLKDTLGRTLGSDFVSVFHTSGAIVTGLVFEGSVPVSGVSVTLTAGATAQTTTTDANGRYRFENVPLGRVTVEASDPITQKADSVVLDISATVGVVTADLSLAFVAGIEGQVFRFDGTPAGAGVEVSVLQGGTEVAFTTTDDTGFYRVSHVPLGSFTVDATHPANGDRGEARGSLTTSGQLVTVNVDLIGVGTVRLFVRDAADNLVPGAQASLSFTRFGQLTRLDNPTAEPDGSLLFVFVLAGPFTVEADDPATGLRATAIGTAVPASEVVVDLVLQLSGSIAATVFFPDGTRAVPGAAVELFRETGSLPKAEQTSDASGRVLFENVPVSESPYRIDVLLDGRLRARRRNVVVEENGQTSVTLQLIGLGTVTGQVIPPSGETLSSSVRVGLTSLAEDIGGFFSDPDGADGIYLISEIPVGPFTLSARDSFNGFLGEADGVITADGETVVIDVQLVDNAINLAAGKRLLDANEGDFRIQKSGSLLAGTDNLFAASDPGGLHLEVTVEGVTARFAGADVGSQEESGREIVTALEDIGGVRVRRKVFVPREGYFARYLEVLENLSPDAVAVSASVVSNLNNANGSPQIVSTSRGDTLIDGSDLWLITDDGEDVDPFLQSVFSIPATAWVLAGEATSLGPASVLFEENVGSSDGRLTVGYDLNLPAGSRVILMHFVSPQLSREAAREAALRLSALPPEALAGLSLEEIAAIANFQVPLDGTSPLAPLPAVNGRIAGQLFAHDGVTAVGTPTGAGTIPVKLQSSHILFRRERIANADAGGNFRFESSFTTSQSLAIPQVDFTLTASPNASVLKQAVATAAGSFSGGPSIVSDSPDLEASASSSASSTSGPEKAFDGFTSTLWVSATGDAANQGATPTLEMTLPAPVEVDFVRIDTSPTFNSEMFRVRLDLLGRAGQVLFTTDVDLPAPDRDLDLPLTPTPGVEGLRLISLNDLGSFVRVAEVEVRGVATSNVGSTLKDLIFHGTAAIAGVTRRVSGEPLASSLNLKSGAFTAGTISTSNGAYFFAPVPVEASPITVNATASVGHSLLKQTEQATLAADTTAQLDILFPETSSVSGRVLSASALPVPGKFVTLFPEFGSAISRSTDANGVYRFDDIPSGNYVLRVIQNSRLIDVPITVNAPTAVVQDIQIPDFGTLDLTVLFETAPGSPVAPAQSAFVTLTDSLGVRTGLTNPSGQLTFTHVAGPTFRASIRHPNNFNAFTQATGSIVEGQTLSLTVIIPAFGRVSGTVRFAGGSGASASQVDISGLGVTLQSRSTGFAGTYFFSNVEALRPFTVRARHPTTNRTHIFAEATGELGAQGATEAVDVTLPATGTVDVTVTEEDGTVIGGAAISIWDSFSTEFRSEGTTRFADGKASIAVVPEGSFTVRAEDSGNLIGEATGEITIDGEQVEIAIVRPRAAAVEGTILAGDGLTAVAGAPVALFSEDGLTLLDSTSSDDAGFYCFPAAVDPGTSALVRAEFPGDAGKSAEVMVSATHPGQTLTADLELPVSVVKGFVLDSDGVTPVAGASVEIQCEGTFDRRATVSNDAGRFVFLNEPPGAFELVAEDGFRLSAFFRTELHAGQLSLTQDIVLPPFGTIEGTVWDSGGAPLAGADVVLTSARLRGPRQVTPDGAGNFRFERVALGSFNLTFDMPTGELDELGQPILIPASVVGRLVAPGEAVLTNITVPPVGTLFGDVLSGGVPVVPGPETTLALEGRQNESSTGIYSRSVPVASDGSYLQEEVPAGDITATAVHAGEAGSAGATVLDGASTRLDVSLSTAVALPAELGPPAGRRHEVQSDGSMRGMVVGRSELTFSSLTVNAKPFAELASARWEPPDLQIVLGPIHTAGILHTRKVFVPDSAPFVRFLEILENPNALPVDVTFAVRGEIQASSLVTSSGDDRLDGADRYLAGELSDGTGVALVFAGTGTVRTPDATRTDGQSYQHVWRGLTVPAGGRVILVHFAVQADTLTNAEAQADALMTLSDSAAFSDLTAEERSQVVNFVVP